MPCPDSLCLFASHILDFASSSFSFCFATLSFSFSLQKRLELLIRSVILQASSSCPSSSYPSFSSAVPSSFRAHSVRGVTTSAAFSCNVSLSLILGAATWSSSSVFTSFYLSDVQFSSRDGFSLGPVVAAVAVL